VALLPEESIGFASGLVAGETGGASPQGAWVACRRRNHSGGVVCGIVARLRTGADAGVRVACGDSASEITLQHTLMPGIGPLYYGCVPFEDESPASALAVEVGSIQGRKL
jgi:hypothetical protein